MSLSVSGPALPQKDFSYDADASRSFAAAKPAQTQLSKHNQQPSTPVQAPPKPTEEQKLQLLIAQGESNQQIATALGLTVTQVEQSLAGTSTAASTASSVVALAGRLSIKV